MNNLFSFFYFIFLRGIGAKFINFPTGKVLCSVESHRKKKYLPGVQPCSGYRWVFFIFVPRCSIDVCYLFITLHNGFVTYG